MLNLLTPEYKAKIRRVYRTRFLTVLLLSVTLTGFVSIVLLIPSFLSALTREQVSENERNTLEGKLSDKSRPDLNKYIEQVGVRLDVLDEDIPQKPSVLIERVIEEKNNAVHLTGFIYSDVDKKELTISGLADSRDGLVLFKRALEKTELFVSIDLPVSHLAAESDISFTIRGVLKQ